MITAAEPAKHDHHNRLQSLCNANCTKGLPEVATNRYKEKAAVATMITAAELLNLPNTTTTTDCSPFVMPSVLKDYQWW